MSQQFQIASEESQQNEITQRQFGELERATNFIQTGQNLVDIVGELVMPSVLPGLLRWNIDNCAGFCTEDKKE